MNPPSTKETRIANLNRIQEERKQHTLTKVEQTLERMVKQGMKINFSTLAKEANVSESYLYKYPEIKLKIAEIRNQQSSMPRPRNLETASAKSNQVIVSRLKDRIKKLEAEVTGLRNINEGLAGRVFRMSELEAMGERQQEYIKGLEEQLKACESRHSIPTPLPTMPANDPKVTPIDKGKRNKSEIPESVKLKLEALLIPLNTTLSKAIKSVSEKITLDAIEAFEEATLTDHIEKPGAWIKAAIENGWRKNELRSCETATGTTNEFSEWFELAKAQGVVRTRRETEEGLMIEDNTGRWEPWESFVKRGWTLEYLKGRAKAR